MNTKDMLFYFMILVVVSLCVYLIVSVKNQSIKCLSSPFIYGVNHLITNYNRQVTCSLSCSNGISNFAMNIFNGTMTPVNEIYNSNYTDTTNYTSLKEIFSN